MASFSAERCCREWASFSALFWTSGTHAFLGTATIGTLGRRAESVVECEQVSLGLVLQYSTAQIKKSLEVSCRQADSRLVTMSHIFVTARKSSTDQEKSRDFVQTSGFTFGDNVTHFCDSFRCSRMPRTVEHLFRLVSSFFFWLREGILTLSLEHIEFCVKTLHLGTVSVCLAWSSPLPRYRCCADCLYCGLET